MSTLLRSPILLIIFALTSCATILTKSNWPISVQTSPAGAKIEIWNKKGFNIYSATTPATLKLRSGAGYFGKESYTVKLSMEGYEPKTINLECKINGWYFGNILIGGILGMIVVDPLTGAMYRLEKDNIYEILSSKPLSGSPVKEGLPASSIPLLFIVKREEIKPGLHDCLIEVIPPASSPIHVE